MPRPGRMTTERAKDFKGTLLQLVRTLGRYRLSLVTAIVFAILSTIFNIAGPKVLAKATTAEKGWYYMDWLNNDDNPTYHRRVTGPALVRSIAREGSSIVDSIVIGVGSGGTITGVGRYLKSRNSAVRVAAVEPKSSAVLSIGVAGAHKIQGIGAGFVPQVLDTRIYDEIIPVTNEDAFALGREIGRAEGVLVGISSGAAVWAALQIAQRPESAGKTIVVLLPDTGDRYLSTPLFAE